MRRRLLAPAVCLALVVTGWASGLAPDAGAATTAPCGTTTLSHTSYKHVIWIFMENHSYGAIIGSSQAPYINAIAKKCGLATNYHNITHPSLPNYLAATTGASQAGVQRFSSDCSPSSTCSTPAPSIFGQGKSWRAYQESMPANCTKVSSGHYAPRHNPPVYFTSLHGCSSYDVPYTRLATDLTNNTLPAFAFITPNLIDDMHDGTVNQGDAWLSKHLPAILNSTAYRAGTVVVFLTWDEGEGGKSNACATNTTDVGCHVATVVMSKSTPAGTRSSTLFNHYSLLRTTEEILKLPLLNQARTAHSMLSPFKL